MPSFSCPSFFARRSHFVLFGIAVLALSFAACGGSRLTTARASKELKPKEQLPERELRHLPNNLIIKIDNVADDRQSYKNYVVLRINGREITPVEKISNFSSAYSYPMRLQPGVYEIKAEYHTVGFWREHVHEITPDEPVKILPDQRTVLEARLEKNHRGELAEKRAKFRVSFENLVTEIAAFRGENISPVKIVPFPSIARTSNIVVPPLHDAEMQEKISAAPAPVISRPMPASPRPAIEREPAAESTPGKPASGALATLQINTSPAGADVIVDDRYYGQSPVKITIDKNQNHVIQIAQQGYKEVVKILNAADLQNEPLMQLVIKLEAVAAKE